MALFHSGGMDLLQGIPGQLVFCFQPDKLLCCHFLASNRTQHPMAFKLKTDAPSCYLCKPAKAVVQPGCSCRIYVYMQPTSKLPSVRQFFLLQESASPEAVHPAARPDTAALQAQMLEDPRCDAAELNWSKPGLAEWVMPVSLVGTRP